MRVACSNPYLLALLPATLLAAGCGGSFRLAPKSVSGHSSGSASANAIVLTAQVAGSTSHQAIPASQPIALQTTSALQWSVPDALNGDVRWSVTGGDPHSGAGSITSTGLYTPPSWLTQDEATVTVHARIADSSTDAATALLRITPGFIRPIAPENLALGAGASASFSASIAEVGGSASVQFALPAAGFGSLSTPDCTRYSLTSENPAYTVCSVTYTAPAAISATQSVILRATVTSPASSALNSSAIAPVFSSAQLLLNSQGVTSNPATHQQALALPVQLGSSAGSNSDYDSARGQLTDCCGGTLGALLADASGNLYALSANHILARSDQAIPGETIIQPGLIDNACTPYGEGTGTTPIASLAPYPLLSAPATRVDAALARVSPATVDPTGAILELGPRQPDGTLAAAPPGVSSTSGRGEAAHLGMAVAKSGRTTGLTCGSVTALHTEVLVDYYRDCAETQHAFRKRFTDQIVVSGPSFSDAGDSGALIVDSSNAEPLGLFFAGGVDERGIDHAIANPASDLLANLGRSLASGATPTPLHFVGTQDHPVACLRYPTLQPAPLPLTSAARAAAAHALELARQWAARNGPIPEPMLAPSADQLAPDGTALPAILFGSSLSPSAPRFFAGIPTQVHDAPAAAPDAAALARVLRVRDRRSTSLFALSPAIFGLGVGLSADNPADPALILFVDRNQPAPTLPNSIDGERLRIIRMERPHVTRGRGQAAVRGCRPIPSIPAPPVSTASDVRRLLLRPLPLP